MATKSGDDGDGHLLSNRLLLRVIIGIGLLAASMVAISLAARYFGDDLTLEGYTPSTDVYDIIVGQDHLSLAANMIRFAPQRKSGPADSVNIQLSWPEMQGFTRDNARVFTDSAMTDRLIFAEFSQSVMSRDMSGRLEPIYKRLFVGSPEAATGGLVLHRLNPKSGFGSETILTARLGNGENYVVRCILPTAGQSSTSADCQRDIHVGQDLTLLYRFSSKRLAEWSSLNAAMMKFARERVHN